MNISPEKALEHLDGIASKYQGTRDDHTVLSSSIVILKEVILQWRKLAEEKKLQESREAKPEAKPEVSPEPKASPIRPLPQKSKRK